MASEAEKLVNEFCTAMENPEQVEATMNYLADPTSSRSATCTSRPRARRCAPGSQQASDDDSQRASDRRSVVAGPARIHPHASTQQREEFLRRR